MNSYNLSSAALRDIRRIRTRLTREESERVADRVESKLFAAMDELARLPQIGHHHPSISHRGLLFATVWEYEIVFVREPVLRIVRVLHGRRNLPRLL